MTSSVWNWLLFTLIQRDKVKWVCVTLNEGYLRSANRGSNNLYRFLIKIKQISLQWKDEFFWSVFFTVFFETADLRIYCGYFLAICQLCYWFCFFLVSSEFLGMVFPIHSLTVVLGLVFLFSQWKFFELYVRTCPAMYFLLRLTDFCFFLPWLLGIDFYTDLSDFYCFVVETLVCDVISAVRSIVWFTSLKNWLLKSL